MAGGEYESGLVPRLSGGCFKSYIVRDVYVALRADFAALAP
ncbi:hypothetical protein ACGFIP_13045 [Micromonospora zamorensis]